MTPRFCPWPRQDVKKLSFQAIRCQRRDHKKNFYALDAPLVNTVTMIDPLVLQCKLYKASKKRVMNENAINHSLKSAGTVVKAGACCVSGLGSLPASSKLFVLSLRHKMDKNGNL